jgi:hypothetical protein
VGGVFPKDAPKRKVVKALESLGFTIVREREHIAMVRDNGDGTRTPLTMNAQPSDDQGRHAPRHPDPEQYQP